MQVLIVGLGSIGRKHIDVLRKNVKNLRIQALRSDKSKLIPQEGIEDIFEWDEVLKPDFILVCNPTSLHRVVIENAIKFNCPLFIEKPLFHELGEAEKSVLKQIADKQIPTYVACNLRFHPVVRFLKSFLQESADRINEVSVYCGSYLPAWRPGTDFTASYSARPELGGGVHLDLIHELDYTTYLFGYPQESRSLIMNNYSLGTPSVDSARYLLKYVGFSVSLTLNYYRRDSKRFIEIVREKDTLMCDLMNCTVTDQVTNKVLFKDENFNMIQTYSDQMNYFLEFKDLTLMNDIKEASEVLRIALS